MNTADTQDKPDIAHTRRELLNFLARSDHKPAVGVKRSASAGDPASAPRADGASEGFHWAPLLEAGLSSWWHAHPARAGAVLLRSATEEYARKKPRQAVIAAAAAGAALVLFRPWRLVSTTAVLFSVLRASNFTGMATSVLETATQSINKERS